jgi:hypothetical protein
MSDTCSCGPRIELIKDISKSLFSSTPKIFLKAIRGGNV